MATPKSPERNVVARSFLQLRRFRHLINADKVFSTHSYLWPAKIAFLSGIPFFGSVEPITFPCSSPSRTHRRDGVSRRPRFPTRRPERGARTPSQPNGTCALV